MLSQRNRRRPVISATGGGSGIGPLGSSASLRSSRWIARSWSPARSGPGGVTTWCRSRSWGSNSRHRRQTTQTRERKSAQRNSQGTIGWRIHPCIPAQPPQGCSARRGTGRRNLHRRTHRATRICTTISNEPVNAAIIDECAIPVVQHQSTVSTESQSATYGVGGGTTGRSRRTGPASCRGSGSRCGSRGGSRVTRWRSRWWRIYRGCSHWLRQHLSDRGSNHQSHQKHHPRLPLFHEWCYTLYNNL